MESHIERLTAACGLRHFSYRAFAAPEIVILPKAVVAEAEEDPASEPEVPAAVAMAPESPPAPASTPLPAPPLAPLPPLPAPASPPIRLAQPPEDQAPAFTLPARRAPVTLPPPDAPVMAAAARPTRPSGRPPVVLPAPDSLDPLIAFRGREHRMPPDRRAAPPPPPKRDAPPRRFALLDEIAPPAARQPGGQDRRAPTTPPHGRS